MKQCDVYYFLSALFYIIFNMNDHGLVNVLSELTIYRVHADITLRDENNLCIHNNIIKIINTPTL